MEPHSTFWGCWPSAPPYWAILEKVHERKNLPRQRRKSISSCIWSWGHNNLIKISRTIKGLHCSFWLRAFTIEVQEITTLSEITIIWSIFLVMFDKKLYVSHTHRTEMFSLGGLCLKYSRGREWGRGPLPLAF